MRSIQTIVVMTLVACAAAAYHLENTGALPQPAAPTPQPSPAVPARVESNQAINDRFEKQFLERVKGRENEPAENVFKNIQWLKGTPAGRFLGIMNGGYSRALGVSCTHCHIEQDFSSDDKRPKRAAREMAVMHRMINGQLAKMENLEPKSGGRFINCATCHRGAINPLAPQP